MKDLEGQRLQIRIAESVETSNKGTVLKAWLGSVSWGLHLYGAISWAGDSDIGRG